MAGFAGALNMLATTPTCGRRRPCAPLTPVIVGHGYSAGTRIEAPADRVVWGPLSQ